MKFTFKKQKGETGLAAIGNSNPDTTIKLNKLVVGFIVGPSWQSKDHKWGIRLMQKTDAGLSTAYKWVKVKERFEKEADARTYIQTNAQMLIGIGLYQREPDEYE